MIDQNIETLLTHSVLPALLAMVEATEQLSEQQSKAHVQQLEAIQKAMMPTEWRTMLMSLDKRLKEDNELKETIKILAEGQETTNNHISNLVESTNTLTKLQMQQNKLLQEMKESFEQNTARLDALTIAIAKNTGDKPLGRVYDKLKAGI